MAETAEMVATEEMAATEEMRMIMAVPVALAVAGVHRMAASVATALTASLRWG